MRAPPAEKQDTAWLCKALAVCPSISGWGRAPEPGRVTIPVGLGGGQGLDGRDPPEAGHQVKGDRIIGTS